MDYYLGVRVDLEDALAGAGGLAPSDIGLAVDDLALKVGLVNRVELDDSQRANPGCRQIHQGGRTESTCANAEHLGRFETLLAAHSDVGDDQVPAIPPDLIDRKICRRLD
ncbi:hypothetical protein GALL_492150 [mine drainage metagenome]|uniref:Uncharacterized protein n=1 Tax=mine drainage metagenome TaxID=410659 RepID=A0A1J5PC04_9ZZZZ